MEKKEFISLLRKPAKFNPAQTAELEEVLDEFPFFQAARALRLKGLRSQNSLHYNKELKVTAAYTTDRGVLFDFITSEEFDQNQIADQIKKYDQDQKRISAEPEEESNLSLDRALKEKFRRSDSDKEKAASMIPEEELSTTEEEDQNPLELGKPLVFHKEENHSFSEWLKLTKAKPIERGGTEQKEDQNKSRKYELIDQFISKSPKIKPAKSSSKTNLAEESLTTPEALMTETLARVYLEQKNFKKAIQAYKILILKNPEKSGFFADQIRAIEKIKDQNNLQ